MKKFSFTLQTVHDIALEGERQLKIEMQRIEEKLRRIVMELNETKAAYAKAKQDLMQEMANGTDAQKLVQYEHYCDRLKAVIQVLHENKLKAEREKDKCLQKQIENRREIKTLENLREKQYEEYLLELRKEEEKEIGDLVAYRTTVSEGHHG